MAVITQYVVERGGKIVLTSVSKKEADAHDKMLDISDELAALIQEKSGLELNDAELEDLSIFLASNKDDVGRVLRGQKLKKEDKES